MDKESINSRFSGESVITELLHRKGMRSGTPISGTFELTARCNFNCKMCYVHQQHPQGQELTAAQWIAMGKEMADRGMVFLLLTGGEPFLRDDFAEIYLGLRRLGLMVSVNTNASLLNDEILAAFRQAPPARVNVSLYGGSEQTYSALCGNAAYATVTKNILRMQAAGIHVKLNATVNPYNASDIDVIYQFGTDHALSVRGTAYMYPPVRTCKQNTFKRFSPKEAAECMLKFREQNLTPEQIRSMSVSAEEVEDECATDGGPMRCRAGRTSFWVTWDGRMLPCGMFPTDGYSLLSNSFDVAWSRVRADVAQVVMPVECNSCSKREHCGACAASCLAENGDTRLKPDYICEMTEWLDQLIQEKYGR